MRVYGADRPGNVATITAVVERHGASIVSLDARLVEGLYVLMAELQLPRGFARLAWRRTCRASQVSWVSRSISHRSMTSCGQSGNHRVGDASVARWHIHRVVCAPDPVRSRPGRDVEPADDATIELAADLMATQLVSPACVGLAS